MTKARASLSSPSARAKLPVSREEIWEPLATGRALGYRKSERGGAWIVRLRVDGKNREQRLATADDRNGPPADGRTVLTYEQAKASVLEARPALRDADGRLVRNRPVTVVGEDTSINMLVTEYFERRQREPNKAKRVMSASAAKNGLSQWRANGQDTIGRLGVLQLDAEGLRRWHAAIAQRGGMNRGQRMAFDPNDPEQVQRRQHTANRCLTIVVSALNMAKRADRLPAGVRDYWNDVDSFRIVKDGEPPMLDDKQVQRLLKALDNAPAEIANLIRAGLYTGSRLGELRSLKVGDFFPMEGVLKIHQFKTGKTMTKALPANSVAFFTSITEGRPAKAPLLAREDGTAWKPSEHKRGVDAVMAAAKLSDYSFKALRSTFGRLLLHSSGNIMLVSQALGHSNPKITITHYARFLPDEVSKAITDLRIG